MDERELRLNSLARYAKSSPLYVLEEHGNCEVPAGCGGVVLRWRNPRAGVPVHMWLYRQGDGALFLDGAPLPSARPVISFGEHVLTFELAVADPRYTVLMFAAHYPPPTDQWVGMRSSAEQDATVSVLSAADGTWRYTASEPTGDAWMLSGFDDSQWQAMVAREDRRPPTFAEYSIALGQLTLMDADVRHIDPFSPFSRHQSQSVIHQNYGCGAGNLVCSISVSGDVNPCSFLGPEFVAANIRDQSLAEIWHRSAGFGGLRALPRSEPGTGARFAGGCRARALVLNGSVNAPDPWITAHAAAGATLNPLAVLDVSAGSCRGGCG